jgi:hypothetical protein
MNVRAMVARITKFIAAIASRNVAETSVPAKPPTLRKASN